MDLTLRSIAASLSPAVKALRPTQEEFRQFSQALERYLKRINEKEFEENHKTHLMDVIKKLHPVDVLIEQHERIDLVIRERGKDTDPVVLFEVKTQRNRGEMISTNDINRKSFQEAVLYYMRERARGNISLQNVVICSTYEFYIFQAREFERHFFGNAEFKKQFMDWSHGRTADSTTDFFYRHIAQPFIASSTAQLAATYFDIREARSERDRILLFKALGPHHITRAFVANDSNTLNRSFYDELLFIIGLEEAAGAKRVIRRRPPAKRSEGSLLEMTLAELKHSDALNDADLILRYGADNETRAYSIALELCLTWINRLLFLKLLEAQLVRFHGGRSDLEFLRDELIADFSELSGLFFQVLAVEQNERTPLMERFEKVPYLNSSLFERTPLERALDISALPNRQKILPFSKTVLRNAAGQRLNQPISTLTYLFRFLGAYDFGAAAGGELRDSSKGLINAAVLGLIFEKINGHADGAVFTPGSITMHMSRRAIERAALDAFKREFPEWTLNSIADIKNHLLDRSSAALLRYNRVIDRLTVCDPAVGSGHFLVSCLNELIALKSRLGILADQEGLRITEFLVEVDNDELIVTRTATNEVFAYQISEAGISQDSQQIQETLFAEKRKLIENCLFGVDINRNSVKICQLRLWIELLKSAYYRDHGRGPLETLPNIDINIKHGDSLLSRFGLDQSLSSAFRSAGLTVREYRDLVEAYKAARNKDAKRALESRIGEVKQRFQAEALDRLSRSINAEIATLRAREAQLNLFDSGADDEKRQRELEKARVSIARLEERRDIEARRRTFLDALEWRFEFPEVLSPKGDFEGFDIVIGNPPYGVPVRGERRAILSKLLGKVPDYEIYYLFLNQARRLLKVDGHLSFIIPHGLLFNVFAKAYRLNLLAEWSEIEFDDLTEFRVFTDAVVRNIIITARKGTGSSSVHFRKTGQSGTILDYLSSDQTEVSPAILREQARNWALVFRLDPEVAKVLAEIQMNTIPLTELFPDLSQGLIAYDAHQGQDEATIKNRIYHKDHPTDRTSPWINGEDVRPFRMKWNGRDYVEYGTHLANPRHRKYFTQPRVLVREITNPTIFAAYTEDEVYNDPAVINILSADEGRFDLKALEAILNSKLAMFYHSNTSPKATRGEFPKILIDDIRQFPLPNPADCTEMLRRLAQIGDEIRAIDPGSSKSGTEAALRAELDAAVFKLYGLKTAAVELVEGLYPSSNREPMLSLSLGNVDRLVDDSAEPAVSER